MHLGSTVISLDDSAVLVACVALVFAQGDHLHFVLGEVLVHEVHVCDLLRGRLRHECIVANHATRDENLEPVLVVGAATVRLHEEAVDFLAPALRL